MIRVRIGFILLVAASLLLTDTASGREPASVRGSGSVERADFNLCTGEWYEIVRLDHPFQQGIVESRVVYQLLPRNRVRVIHQGIDGKTGKKKITHAKGRFSPDFGSLQISFFWFFYGGFAILESDPDGQWTIVGGRSERYLWVLARRPKLSATVISRILSRVAERGYDVGKLHFVDQRRNIGAEAAKLPVLQPDTRSFIPNTGDCIASDTVVIRFLADSSGRE